LEPHRRVDDVRCDLEPSRAADHERNVDRVEVDVEAVPERAVGLLVERFPVIAEQDDRGIVEHPALGEPRDERTERIVSDATSAW
jgi:hypothetical protein